MEKKIALHRGFNSHLLDHIATFAIYLDIPLLITDYANYLAAKKFYPMATVLYEDYSSLSYEKLVKKFDIFFQCTAFEEKVLQCFAKAQNKEIRCIVLPHGNSDKGYKKPMLECYTNQDAMLLYGKHMVDRLKKQNIYNRLPPHAFCGNYRKEVYLKHRSFFDQLTEQEVFSKLDPTKKTILYAPTWQDQEQSSSLFSWADQIFHPASAKYNVIVKTHPRLLEANPAEFWASIPEKVPHHILLLEDFPPIYPLLNRTDFYLGDFSSIGYDFLYFQRPMFFLNPCNYDLEDPSSYLHQTGTVIPEDIENIYHFIDEHLAPSFKEKQKHIYDEAFGCPIPAETLQKGIEKLYVYSLHLKRTLEN